jgi:hypothetical protein
MREESTTPLGVDKSNRQGGKKNRSRSRKQESKQQQQLSSTVDTVESGVGKTSRSGKRPTSKPRSNNAAATTTTTTTPKQQRPPVASNTNNTSSRAKGERGSGKIQDLYTPPPSHTTENSKFAFSAFQASPDASLLPIPTFHRSSDDKDDHDSQQNFVRTPPPAPQDDQQNRSQQRRNDVSSPNPSPINDPTIVLSKAIAELSLQPKQIQVEETSPVAALSLMDESNREKTSPITGINLASLQSSAIREQKSEEKRRSSDAVPFDPVAALLNVTSNTSGGDNLQALQKPIMGDNWSIPPYNVKYITIPVLVPPNLPPNRVIAVQAPPPAISSPIYVQVPHHVVPGMVVPVQVPVGGSINPSPILGYSQLPYSDANFTSRQQQQQPAMMHHSYSSLYISDCYLLPPWCNFSTP